MRSPVIALVACIAVLAGCTAKSDAPADTGMAAQGVATPPADRAADEAAIRQLDAEFFNAVQAKNAAGAAATYASDATSLPPNSPPLKGTEAITRYTEQVLKTPELTMTGESTDIDFSDDGTVAYATGKYSVTFKDAKGKTIKDEGKYLNVLKKIDGKWKIVADAFNSNTPLPAQ